MATEILRAEHLTKSYSGVCVLDDVSISLRAGRVSSLVGENGSGKTTLIKILAGVETPDRGLVLLNGRSCPALRPIDAIRAGVQVIYQDFSLFPNLSVKENLAINTLVSEGRRLVDRKRIDEVARNALGRIGARIDPEGIVEQLPVADRQLIAIARAVLHNARVIVMDEPTSSLTRREVTLLFDMVRRLRQEENVSFLFVSHHLDEVREISDEVFILRNGRLVAEGPATEFDNTSLVFHMTGSELTEKSHTFNRDTSSLLPALETQDLSRTGSFEKVSFKVFPGEMVGIAGLLGSGRTPLAQALFGALPATSGSIRIDGRPVRLRSVVDAVRCGIAYVPDNRIGEAIFPTMSVGLNLITGILGRLRDRLGLLDRRRTRAQIDAWIDRLQIRLQTPDQPVATLSGGNQQRVVMARWLATRPRVLLLNGPTVGVDIGSKAAIHDMLRELARSGMALIVVSDDIPELLQLCNRILLMRDGRLVGDFRRADLTEQVLTEKLLEH